MRTPSPSRPVREAPNAPRPEAAAWAFTRLELAALLAGLGLLALIALPALANNRERSARVLCLDNLRLLGHAFAQWGTEHSGKVPARTFWYEGGLRAGGTPPAGTTQPGWFTGGFQNNAWFHFAWLSNEVRSPKILVCPADKEKVVARGWGSNADGGYVHANYQSRSASYLVSLDVYPASRLGLLSGDRNVRYSSISGSCSSGIAPSLTLDPDPIATLGVDGKLHVAQGNFLFSDGRVEELSDQGFASRIRETLAGQDNGVAHYIVP